MVATSSNSPDYCGNACAFFSDEDKEKLWKAACALVNERGLVVRITGFVGPRAIQFCHSGLDVSGGGLT